MRQMRRIESRRDEDWAMAVFDRAPFVMLSMVRPDGTPYALPLSMARAGRSFYFHCAVEGEKLDCIRAFPIVSLSAVSRCTPKFEEKKQNFTEHYQSAVALGRAEILSDDAEKIEALRIICERFLPKYMSHFDSAVKRSLERTAVVRVTLTEPPVGKCKS
ncbi:MAG: pyridoxamine 5'-phosphate oxidase family protein [Muribaculaceae bacterium]|nr:pyridoxamine 5'-phosphate oxidase family protein [Muribaculaceae bacterium]